MYYVWLVNDHVSVLARCYGIISAGDEAAYVFDGQNEEHRGMVKATLYLLSEDDECAVFARNMYGKENLARVTARYSRYDMPEAN